MLTPGLWSRLLEHLLRYRFYQQSILPTVSNKQENHTGEVKFTVLKRSQYELAVTGNQEQKAESHGLLGPPLSSVTSADAQADLGLTKCGLWPHPLGVLIHQSPLPTPYLAKGYSLHSSHSNLPTDIANSGGSRD